jgi:hypothetical protein
MSVSTNEGGEFQLDSLSYWRDYGDCAKCGIIPVVSGRKIARLLAPDVTLVPVPQHASLPTTTAMDL